jgi:phosphatidylglycerol---prolipoprotein diacylglyceryl transferase
MSESERSTGEVSAGGQHVRLARATDRGAGACPVTLRYTQMTVPIAVVIFDFDPTVQLFGEVAVRWGSIALVAVLVAALAIAGLLARADDLRPDDVAFVAVGIVPGAVIGARLGYLIVHADTFGSTPERMFDPSVGGLELGLAVVGGFVTGSYVANLLGPSVGRWLHLAALPILFAMGAGKLTMVLTGTGQGSPSSADWATAYLGAGPWGSLAPALPSHPSQAYEGLATLAIVTVLTLTVVAGAFRSRDGRLFFTAIGLWAIARAVVSTTWRDPVVAGGLNASGLIAVAIAVGCAVALVIVTVRGHRSAADLPPTGPRDEPDPRSDAIGWADPVTRPRF